MIAAKITWPPPLWSEDTEVVAGDKFIVYRGPWTAPVRGEVDWPFPNPVDITARLAASDLAAMEPDGTVTVEREHEVAMRIGHVELYLSAPDAETLANHLLALTAAAAGDAR